VGADNASRKPDGEYCPPKVVVANRPLAGARPPVRERTDQYRMSFGLRDVLATASADPDPRDSRRSVRSGTGSINGSGSADGTTGNALADRKRHLDQGTDGAIRSRRSAVPTLGTMAAMPTSLHEGDQALILGGRSPERWARLRALTRNRRLSSVTCSIETRPSMWA
jgi:hypothetical protein